MEGFSNPRPIHDLNLVAVCCRKCFTYARIFDIFFSISHQVLKGLLGLNIAAIEVQLTREIEAYESNVCYCNGYFVCG